MLSSAAAGRVPARGLAAHIPDQDWADLGRLGVVFRFGRGEVMFHQGDEGRHVHLLLVGAVKVTKAEADGGEALLTLRAAGDLVGDMAALDGRPRSATVTALTPVTSRWLTYQQFRAFVERPSVSGGFARYTMARLREADQQRTEIALLPVRVRFARALLRLATPAAGEPGALEVRLAQEELARLVGASRNAIVGELTELRKAGVLATRRGAVIIHDSDRLGRLCCANPPQG